MTILTRSKTQKSRFATLSKFEFDRCYRLAYEQLSKEDNNNNNNKEDNEIIYSETISDDYDTLTNTSTV
ncbi:hypothetical protein C1645_833978 [Glomus cerebriforme]|uniref:Uncharacterized protein n=1 Tax=Glomus cerebriforme TaxID=658196 RepID=A0A397SF38_9GLOM|nr:hypothetical protein C1645_833978 [Glomus cerebriforme]